jgi:hypothetical protein
LGGDEICWAFSKAWSGGRSRLRSASLNFHTKMLSSQRLIMSSSTDSGLD